MSCEHHQSELVAFVRGELEPLPRQRLASHLAHCLGCSALARTLATGFAAARGWEPEVAPEHLDRLTGRLAPWLETAPAPRRAAWRWAASVAALAFASAVAVVLLAPLRRPVDPGVAALELAPTPFVRVAAEARWDGVVTGGPSALVYAMTRGAAGFSFTGGEGRRLSVRTPLGEVRAVGTRFVVALADDALTVAVGDGEVRVSTAAGEVAVAAGVEVRFGRDGAERTRGTLTAASTAILDRPFLAHAAVVSRIDGAPGPGLDFDGAPALGPGLDLDGAPALGPGLDLAGSPTPHVGLVARLERAEQLAAEGQARAAVAIYSSCSRERGLAVVLADLCRLEAARLTAFALGEPERARPVLTRLARTGQGETRRQAALALCELDRRRDPCGAAACLRRLAAGEGFDTALRREAARLAAEWAGAAGCDGARP